MDGLLILGADFLSPFPLFHSFPLFPIISTTKLFCVPARLSPPPSSRSVSYSCDLEMVEMISSDNNDLNFCISVLPFLCRPVAEGQSSTAGGLPTSIVVSLPTAPPPPPLPSAPARPNNSLSNRRPGVLPANLEEMKVFANPVFCLQSW